MRPILFAAAMIGAASVLASTDAMAQLYPRVPSFGARFYGPGFFAPRFFGPRFFGPALYGPGFYGPRFYRPGSAHVGIVRKKAISTRQASTKHVSTKQASTKHVSTKHASTKKVTTKQVATRHVSTRDGSTMRPAATPGGFARPGVRTVIPLPEQELLTPAPEFNCEFKTTSVGNAGGQPQPSPTRAQTDPSTPGELRKKLEYERECYRHAEIILRDRLRQLQAAVGETIEAVNRSEQPAATTGISTGPARTVIPLPEQELLTAQPEFDCEFKTTSVDDASDQPQTSPTHAQADLATDVTLRMKLDYERECYRHTEMIVRDRLRLLQVSVGETMKAVILGTIETKAPQDAQ
jgi:hypothetical protein